MRTHTGRPGHVIDFGPAKAQFVGQATSHQSGRMIAKVSHRINRFHCRPCSQQDLPAGVIRCFLRLPERAGFRKMPANPFRVSQKRFRFRHTAFPLCATGQSTRCGSHHFHTPLPKHIQIGLSSGMLVHTGIHSRSQNHRLVKSIEQRGQRIISYSVGELGNRIGRCRRHDHEIGPIGITDMRRLGLVPGGKQIRIQGIPAQGLQGQRGDKFQGGRRAYAFHLRSVFYQKTNKSQCLVGSNAT